MNCKECGELLIDYMHGELDAKDHERVTEHIESCAECSRELEEFTEIRRAVSAESVAEPSSEILEDLSLAAWEESSQSKKPFWKKWSYSPILVPAISSVIALSVWFYYGGEDIYISPSDTFTTEVGAEKVHQPRMRDYADTPAAAVSESGDFRAATSKDKEASQKYRRSTAGTSRPEELDMLAEDEMLAEPPMPPAPSSAGKDAVSEKQGMKAVKNKEQMLKKEDAYEQRFVDEIESYEEEAPARDEDDYYEAKKVQEKSVVAKSEIIQRTQLDAALTQQRQGDCKNAIETNEALLNTKPAPPEDVQGASYLSLAECYEQVGKPEEAIANYINLQQVAPEQVSFANSRIEEIKLRSSALMLESEPAKTDEAK